MFRRMIACLAALVLLAGCSAYAENQADENNSLTVGSTTQMRGEFFTEAWGNATSDYDVKDLLHGYNLVFWNADEARFEVDHSVVSGIAVTENEQHDRSYMLVLQHDLRYSDGSFINAWDYAFSFLLRIAPELEKLGGKPDQSRYLLGYDNYITGQTRALAGIRVTADDTLTITVSHEYLPFFYELGLLQCNPYPIHVIAPGVTVRDDGNGVYLANEDESLTAPVFSAELLEQTLCDPETGYRSHPSVVSGPYTLTSWDGTTATFEINPRYKGDHEGSKPLIQSLTYTLAANETMIDDLGEGKFGLLNKVTNVTSIEKGMSRMADSGIRFSNYPRIGLSYISFCCENETVASQAVRQAIAWCLDRDEVVRSYVGSFGLRSDGYYGVGQWMYGVLNGTIAILVEEPEDGDAQAAAEYEKAVAAWSELSLDGLTAYTVDLNKAGELLDRDGWLLNADGIREKVIAGETYTLDLKMLYPAGSTIADVFTVCLIPNLETVGIRLTMEPAEMPDLLSMFYRQGPRDADMFCLASNFDLIFDPSLFFREEGGKHVWLYSAYADDELYQLASDLRKTEPGDTLEYCTKWIRFQERFNETLPMLPLYTNVYFDFYTNRLHDYAVSSNTTWAQALLGASLYDEPAAETEAE